MSETERNKLLLIFLAELSMLCEGFDVKREKGVLKGVLPANNTRRKIELSITDKGKAVVCFLKVDDQWLSAENLESVSIPNIVSAPYVMKFQGAK